MFHRNYKIPLMNYEEEEDGNERKRMEGRKTKQCRGFRFKSLPYKVVKLVKLVYNPFDFDIP